MGRCDKVGILAAVATSGALDWTVYRPTALLPRTPLGTEPHPVRPGGSVDPALDHIRGPQDAAAALQRRRPRRPRPLPGSDVRYAWRHLQRGRRAPDAARGRQADIDRLSARTAGGRAGWRSFTGGVLGQADIPPPGRSDVSDHNCNLTSRSVLTG